MWFAILTVSAHGARADWSFDFYGGAGFTHDHDAQVALPEVGITGVHRSLEFDTASLIGGRFAYWNSLTALFGFAFDVSHFFGPDQPEQLSDTELFANGIPVSDGPELIRRFEISVTSLAFDVLYFRLPISVSANFPGGRLQPYVTAGPEFSSHRWPTSATSCLPASPAPRLPSARRSAPVCTGCSRRMPAFSSNTATVLFSSTTGSPTRRSSTVCGSAEPTAPPRSTSILWSRA